MARGLCSSSGRIALHAGTEASVTENDGSSGARGGGVWCKQVMQPASALCCFPQVVLCLCSWPGEGNGTRQLLCPQRRKFMLAAVREALPEEQIISLMHPRHFSDHCFHTASSLLACLKQHSALWGVFQQGCGPLSLQSLDPLFAEVRENQPLSFSQSLALGYFSRAIHCVLLSLSLSFFSLQPGPLLFHSFGNLFLPPNHIFLYLL